jgi:transmembrane protein 216
MQGRPMSSLPLQIIMYFDNIYTAIYWVLEILVYVYKGSNFLYPPHALGSEITAVSFLALLQYFRLFTGNL